MSEKRKWYGGPPPHIGWWNAGMFDDPEIWRWWDGAFWSLGVHCSAPGFMAAETAERKTKSASIYWTDYYPSNARVPRIAP